MAGFDRQAHWQQVYKEKGENRVSWFQERPAVSLELIQGAHIKPSSAIIDIGGGASRLVDALVEKGFQDLTVLDLSDSAVSIAKMRLGHRAGMVKWIVADVTHWEPSTAYDMARSRRVSFFDGGVRPDGL
jgi:trans-aconitate methyltransferase